MTTSYESQENNNEEVKFSFIEMEKSILSFWKNRQIFKKSLEKSRSKQPYIFYDGPPFATGLPHHGHLVASTLKDIVPRYFTMRGYYVDRRFGWDCHGLPIEQQIDKQTGMSALEFVTKHGVREYNKRCRDIVLTYTSEWEKTIDRIGRWVDFENDYKTMDPAFMESVWWVFQELWKKDLIYQGNKVVAIGPAFGSVLSNFEASSNYQMVQDPSILVLFPLEDKTKPKHYFLAWTTTPWTLPGNLGLCVNPEATYVLCFDQAKDIHFIMAKDLVGKLPSPVTIVEEMPGSKLVGLKYTPLFDDFSSMKEQGAFQVHGDAFVTMNDGSGVVHLAPGYGEDDFRVMKKSKNPLMVLHVDEFGKFTDEVKDFAGMSFKDADKEIIKKLKEKNLLYHQSTLNHSYPMCPRTDTPLLYRAISSWYVNVEKIKSELLNSNAEVNWVPEHIKEGRFGNWLKGARDWAISRNRYWGTPIPIWINDETKKAHCVGSIQELQKLTKRTDITDIHPENVNDLTFTLPNEVGTYRRIKDVFDCWFESGSMPYAQLHYPFENKEHFEKGFPAEFIAEGLDQTRGWFYTLTVLSTALFKRPAFKNVIVNGLVLASDGKKMSKRLKNYTPPDELMETHGADALRLYLINSALVRGEELRFVDAGVKDMTRRVLLPWYSAFHFFKTYAELDNFIPREDFQVNNITDRWILSRLELLTKKVNHEMNAYKLYNVVPHLFDFVEDLTNWYIRLNRRRFWEAGQTADKLEAYQTLYTVLMGLNVLMAPFAPFLSEHIYLQMKKMPGYTLLKEESVHLHSYLEDSVKFADTSLEKAVKLMQEVILLGRQKRNLKQIKVKTPLSTLTIVHQDKAVLDSLKDLEVTIKTELNVKNIHYSQKEEDFIRLFAKPNAPLLGKKLGSSFMEVRKKIESLDHQQLLEIEAGKSIEIATHLISSEEILIFREPKADHGALSNRFITIDLDCEVTEELLLEGLAREVVNRIQKMRKEKNLVVSDRINTVVGSKNQQIKKAILAHTTYIAEETLSVKVDLQDQCEEGQPFDIEGLELTILVTKAS